MSVRYIATGFINDLNLLLNNFLKRNSKDLEVFMDVWIEHEMNKVFWGRDGVEYISFVNEIYQLTLNYMMSTDSREEHVGCIYVLYALYISQTNSIPIKIRITQNTWQVLMCVEDFAIQNKEPTLLYVLNYLHTNNCFVKVASPILFGPCTNQRLEDQKPLTSAMAVVPLLKRDLTEFFETQIMPFKNKYLDYMRRNPASSIKSELLRKEAEFNQMITDFSALMGDGQSKQGAVPAEDIGLRRSRLKQFSFQKKATFRYLNEMDEVSELDLSDIDSSPPPKALKSKGPAGKPRAKRRRMPKHLRKMGRPSKSAAQQLTAPVVERKSKIPLEANRRAKMNRRAAVRYATSNESTILNEAQLSSSGGEEALKVKRPELSEQEEDEDYDADDPSDASSCELRF